MVAARGRARVARAKAHAQHSRHSLHSDGGHGKGLVRTLGVLYRIDGVDLGFARPDGEL